MGDPSQSALLENNKLPKSHIVYQSTQSLIESSGSMMGEDDMDLENELTPYKLKGYLLFRKYVDSDCGDLQINISHRTRQELMGRVKGNDCNLFLSDSAVDGVYLFSMWTAVIEELYTLLNQSFNRFRNQKGNCLILSA